MDVVWLKRDVRLHDHAPLQAACHQSDRPICILYLYEPDQLSETTVHGSHISIINEGLVDFDRQLRGDDPESQSIASNQEFRYLTICRSNAIPTLQYIHKTYTIKRMLAHEETGHYASYQRDRQVRKWCKESAIPFKEFVQSGVTRRLSNRDDFSKKLKTFLEQPQCSVNLDQLRPRVQQLTCSDHSTIQITQVPLLDEIIDIPIQHRVDRASRQRGGERAGLKTLQSFLGERGKLYSAGISSPLSSWTSCSRLSVFLSWGHLSLRRVHQATRQRCEALKRLNNTGNFRKSLGSFQSRLYWRAHYTQKLESDPLLEKRDLHPSYQHLRRQPGDWNEAHFQAWSTGSTGFPFVDACMRCLIQTGWLNFRMRAMLVSFATYNLWLDWKRIAPHLARVFLDYEPGIHYPQLQMQAGTTGINAMRVYSVIKQGNDQDPDGIFVKRYVPELRRVPKQYIHEPWKMTKAAQQQCQVWIGNTNGEAETRYFDTDGNNKSVEHYPTKIVDEQESARIAKTKVNDIRKQESTKEIAQQVYHKHGSRGRRDDMPTKRKPKDQPGIESFLIKTAEKPTKPAATKKRKQTGGQTKLQFSKFSSKETKDTTICSTPQDKAHWSCRACTFLNDKPLGLACSVCGTQRKARVVG